MSDDTQVIDIGEVRRVRRLDKEKDMLEGSVETFRGMVMDCPNPTQTELRKLLAVQSVILNRIGMEILVGSRKTKRNGSKMNMALKYLTASREAVKAAAVIVTSDEGETEPELDSENVNDLHKSEDLPG